MSTHAAAGKQWNKVQLDGLTLEDGFRLRGVEVTRLDTFVDATFAFVLTLLVISFDELPSSHEEMLTAAKRVPAFAASFAILMMYWLQHRRWGRRYGLENKSTLRLSLLFIFVVLVYVYPLRMIFEGMFSSITAGYFPSSYRIQSYEDLRILFVFYSVGVVALSLIISLLYRAAARQSESLALDVNELRMTNMDMQRWFIFAAIGLVSIIFAISLPDKLIQLAGYVYITTFGLAFLPEFFDRRKAS